MEIKHLKKMRFNYKKKLMQLRTFGRENGINGRIKETEDSIKLLDSEIKKLTNKNIKNDERTN